MEVLFGKFRNCFSKYLLINTISQKSLHSPPLPVCNHLCHRLCLGLGGGFKAMSSFVHGFSAHVFEAGVFGGVLGAA